jgi:ABC-type glycerol-3-phosphate transport system substrate-binding protein
VILCRTISKCVVMFVTLALMASALMPMAVGHVRAEDTVPLIVSVPSLWQDVLTPDLLATFEAQYGVSVTLVFSDTAFFGFGPGSSAITDHLDSTEELVNSADVMYVSSSTLTAADTQAGYFLDLAPLAMNDPAMDTADFIPAAWQSYQWDNGLWALPLSVDAILLTYDPAAFDEAGLAYPNERWTIDDFANAARQLTLYNADGTVATPGFSTVSGGNNEDVLLRALAGTGFYDPATMPNAPSFSNNANLEYILQTGYEMIQDGVVLAQGGGRDENIPLRVEGINGYTQRRFNPNDNQPQETRYASLLPGGVAGLNTLGFAVSAGTQSPELAYDLAKFLTLRPELANNMFSAAPARYSLAGTQAANNNNGGGAGGGPGGAAFFIGNRTIPDTIQPTVDQGFAFGLPLSEMRYASYVSAALTEMSSNGGDALSALQLEEAQAVSDMQTATARLGTVNLYVEPPAPEPTLAPGKIELTCAVNLGFGGGPGRRGELPSQTEWDQLVADFIASDPEVGAVNLESTQEQDLATLAEQYDCFILPSNAAEGSDVSMLLSLDPLLDNDPTFDRNDVIGNTLAQLQQDNKTWALPLAIQPQMLEYDSQQFAQAGVPEPVNGWSAEAFTDALRMLKPYDTDPAPFVPNDPSGSYLLMLIAAYGGLPLDYRTDPATINFTDPATVDAIRQVLDLAANGYISYSTLAASEGFVVVQGENSTDAITTSTLSRFNFRPRGGSSSASTTTLAQAMYPQGSQYGVIAYEITTGYISATTQNPNATYRFLSAVARSPQLFSGMPVRQSLVNDPAVVASQGADVAAIYQQLDTLLRAPNTIVFPTFTIGRGGGGLSMMDSYWLRRAFDRYVSEGADLDAELADAEMYTKAYRECTQNIVIDTAANAAGGPGQMFQQISQCATSVDPTFTLGG